MSSHVERDVEYCCVMDGKTCRVVVKEFRRSRLLEYRWTLDQIQIHVGIVCGGVSLGFCKENSQTELTASVGEGRGVKTQNIFKCFVMVQHRTLCKFLPSSSSFFRGGGGHKCLRPSNEHGYSYEQRMKPL